MVDYEQESHTKQIAIGDRYIACKSMAIALLLFPRGRYFIFFVAYL